jgi:hypothetical protein
MTEETKSETKVQKKKQTVPLWLFITSVIAALLVGTFSGQGEATNSEQLREEIQVLEDQLAFARTQNANSQPTQEPVEEAPAPKESFADGLYVVGTVFPAGVYTTEGPSRSSCYYAWLTSTGSDADIIDNNIIDGPVTVTLVDGEVFESSGCSTWFKVG